MAHVNRKQYWKIFFALTGLTALEVGVVYIPGIGKVAAGVALCTLALVKVTLVGWYFMHLGHETRTLKLTVAIPMAVPAFYAFVLIAEATWRLI